MVLLDQLSEYTLYLPSDCHRKCQGLRVEGCGGAGNIENSEEIAVNGVPERSGRTGPSLDFAAEVLGPMDLSRLQRGDGGSNRIGSDVCLSPLSPLLKVDAAALICRSWISRCLNNDSRWICQDDDGICLSQEESRLLQRRTSRRN